MRLATKAEMKNGVAYKKTARTLRKHFGAYALRFANERLLQWRLLLFYMSYILFDLLSYNFEIQNLLYCYKKVD